MSEGLTFGHLNELLSAAMRHRDLHRADATAVRKKNQELELDMRRLKIKIEALEARLERSERDKEDLRSLNAMLQRMLKRVVPRPKR
jgi:hypothetical protein